MEEEEVGDFDPKDSSLPPRDTFEIDLCTAYARSQLFVKAGKKIPEWRNTINSQPAPQTMFSNLSVEIPVGKFFYPCSGNDITFPISFFADHVEEFHFADPINLNYGMQNASDQVRKINSEKIPWIGNVINQPESIYRKEIRGNKVVLHRKDGLFTLLENLSCISVFFYRGDSAGEGGSGQMWQGPVLLDLVLSRIMSGGLICVDESNGSGILFNNLRTLDKFNYRNLTLKKLNCQLPGKNGRLVFWQISENF